MKEKILPFIIGLLVGAIIATGCFYLYNKNHKPTFPGGDFKGGPGGMFNGERPELPEGMSEDGERPEPPEGVNENGERPDKENAKENKSAETEKADSGETTNTENV